MKPNILFLVIDSLRSDKINEIHEKPKIPVIDSMKKNGINFTNAITTNQYTAQVLQSIFSSRFLIDDNITRQYYLSNNYNSNSFLNTLKKNGYFTCVTCQEDVFLHGFKEKFDDTTTVYKSEDNIYNGLKHTIFEKLESLTNPWFYYIHLEDLHIPCIVPKDFEHLNLSERYDHNISQIDGFIGEIIKKIDVDKTLIIITADHGEYISLADGPLKEIKGMKTNVKKLVKTLIPNNFREQVHLKKQSLNREIQANKVSKPNEKRKLSYKREMLNNVLFDDILNVPLIFYGYGIPSSKLISQQISNVDIFPTIFDLIKISNPTKNIHGQSLVPMIKNLDFKSIPLYLTSQAIIKQLQMNIKINPNFSPVIGIRTNDFKYFRDYKNSKKNIHLYNLKIDPLENENIAHKNTEIIKNMELNIQNFEKNLATSLIENNNKSEIDADEDKKIRESLKKLGYI